MVTKAAPAPVMSQPPEEALAFVRQFFTGTNAVLGLANISTLLSAAKNLSRADERTTVPQRTFSARVMRILNFYLNLLNGNPSEQGEAIANMLNGRGLHGVMRASSLVRTIHACIMMPTMEAWARSLAFDVRNHDGEAIGFLTAEQEDWTMLVYNWIGNHLGVVARHENTTDERDWLDAMLINAGNPSRIGAELFWVATTVGGLAHALGNPSDAEILSICEAGMDNYRFEAIRAAAIKVG